MNNIIIIDEAAKRRLKTVFYIRGCCHIGYAQRTATQVWGKPQGVMRQERGDKENSSPWLP